MRVSRFLSNPLGVAIFVLVLTALLPATAFGQGRWHRNERGFGSGKKCGKFVNCHDARDGRWDRRGPRRTVTVFRNGILVPRTRVRERTRYYNGEDRFRYPGLSYGRYGYGVRGRRLELRDRAFVRRNDLRHRRHWHHRQ